MGVHDGHRDRKRDQFLRCGAESFAEHELLELLLFLLLLLLLLPEFLLVLPELPLVVPLLVVPPLVEPPLVDAALYRRIADRFLSVTVFTVHSPL